LKVVASFTVIADLARNVGGDRVDITTIVGPDGDAHVYEPSPTDAVAMAKADVVLVNGLHFEGFLQRLVEASATNAAIVELTRGVTPINFKPEFAEADDDHADAGDAAHDHGAIDPHAFQSIPNAEAYVRNIAEAFCAADTEGCVGYQTNAAAYTKKLQALDSEVRAAIASIPAEKRVVITSHDAFGYFEHEYGLSFLAPQGISTDAEPSAADVAKLVEQVKHDRAAAIFVENITNPRLIEQIASETGIKVGGTLYSDALSGADGPAATYIDMMENNVRQIKGAIMGS
jgi:zinc/manganese transport system substrate-binding protein